LGLKAQNPEALMVDTEPLPSWNNGAPKSAILGFVGHFKYSFFSSLTG
jgi:hypothetical protein